MDQNTAQTAGQTTKLPVFLKFSLAVGDFSKSTLQILNAFFLLWFYTDVAKIPAAAATVIMIIARVWDAVNDPMMGVLLDKTRSKEGKCRFWLKYFSVPAGVFIVLSYTCPGLKGNALIAWVGITYIFQGMAQTITNIPFNTLLARITTDKEERVKLGQWRGFGGMIASTLITATALPLVKLIGHGDQTKGFFAFAIICGVIYAAGFLLVFYASKGYEHFDPEELETKEEEKKNKEKTSVKALIVALLKNKYALIVCLINALFLIYNALNGASTVYYLNYNLHNQGLMSVYSIMTSVIGFIAVAGMGFMGKKFGNAKSCGIASVLLIISYGTRFLTHDAFLPVLFACWGIEGIGAGLFAQMIYQCALDAMTYGKWKTGVDNQGTVMSIYTFAQKLGLALGGIIASSLLTAYHYVPNAKSQTEAVKSLFFNEIVTMPAVTFIVLFFLFMYLARLEKNIPQMEAEIAARDAAELKAVGTMKAEAAAAVESVTDDSAQTDGTETSAEVAEKPDEKAEGEDAPEQ
ncbi:MAG: MFS transporter [Mobilibacterium timonense]|uniref:MFS transporter n=1 Tax=Mobilibacterium timonense TaxID=1871012 RepID=UPI00135665F2|nr:glycoside-pentoside-hexuronide (GPH):cation symporter [Mobilibacterium timonense]MBM6989923.1 MFS transporter [Mobilibacterium timonense]